MFFIFSFSFYNRTLGILFIVETVNLCDIWKIASIDKIVDIVISSPILRKKRIFCSTCVISNCFIAYVFKNRRIS